MEAVGAKGNFFEMKVVFNGHWNTDVLGRVKDMELGCRDTMGNRSGFDSSICKNGISWIFVSVNPKLGGDALFSVVERSLAFDSKNGESPLKEKSSEVDRLKVPVHKVSRLFVRITLEDKEPSWDRFLSFRMITLEVPKPTAPIQDGESYCLSLVLDPKNDVSLEINRM